MPLLKWKFSFGVPVQRVLGVQPFLKGSAAHAVAFCGSIQHDHSKEIRLFMVTLLPVYTAIEVHKHKHTKTIPFSYAYAYAYVYVAAV